MRESKSLNEKEIIAAGIELAIRHIKKMDYFAGPDEIISKLEDLKLSIICESIRDKKGE